MVEKKSKSEEFKLIEKVWKSEINIIDSLKDNIDKNNILSIIKIMRQPFQYLLF